MKRLAALLIITSIVVAFASVSVFDRLTTSWFSRDLEVRSNFVYEAVKSSLLPLLETDRKAEISQILDNITKDERLYALALCQKNGVSVAETQYFNSIGSCGALAGTGEQESHILRIASGSFHITNIPLEEGKNLIGELIFVHNLNFAQLRSSTSGRYLYTAFFVLCLAVSLATLFMTRLIRRDWIQGVQAVIREKGALRSIPHGNSKELLPIVRELRRVISELELKQKISAGAKIIWEPKTLKNLLTHRLAGDEVIIVANREPYIHVKRGGSVQVQKPASGVVTALEPIMRACSGVWIAHGSGNADRQAVDEHDRVLVPPGENSYQLRRIWMTPEEEKGYYYGFANEGLWPLCHIAHTRPTFRSSDWEHYIQINERFADAVISESTSDSPVVLVQDYHFAILPAIIREKLPKATIITFWHIPWPNPEAFGICPWREEILQGLLGSTIVGFHTRFHRNNFFDTADRFLECRIDREHSTISYQGKMTAIRDYPISIAWPETTEVNLESFSKLSAEIRKKVGLNSDCKIAVGIDRLDYTKGILERFAAVERLFELYPASIDRFSLIQIAAPSRTDIGVYSRFGELVEAEAKRINDRFSEAKNKPINLIIEYHDPESVQKYYRAADICMVTSLHDGMNLVAKEFIASREDERGVLILSMFTGASRELAEALIVNPYNSDQCAEAIQVAIEMSEEEQQDRMRSMREQVRENNVYRWAGRMLIDAAEVRQKMKLDDRLSESYKLAGIA